MGAIGIEREASRRSDRCRFDALSRTHEHSLKGQHPADPAFRARRARLMLSQPEPSVSADISGARRGRTRHEREDEEGSLAHFHRQGRAMAAFLVIEPCDEGRERVLVPAVHEVRVRPKAAGHDLCRLWDGQVEKDQEHCRHCDGV